MHAVELEQMGVHLGRAEIVDRDEIEILAARFEECPECEPADPAKSVDGDALVSHPLPYLLRLADQITARAARDGLGGDAEMLI